MARHLLDHTSMAILCLEVLLGALTFTGSLMASGKLQEILPKRPIDLQGPELLQLLASLAALVLLRCVTGDQSAGLVRCFPLLLVLALIFGVLLIMPIGGADMPTVIALLNSYAGLSASMMGFVLN